MQVTINSLKARKILDSRGDPTIEVEINVKMGRTIYLCRAAAPSGKSRGKHEVMAFPENGVDGSIRAVRDIVAPKLLNRQADDQKEIDSLLHELDGTPNFSNIGGNAAVAISMVVAKASASALGMPVYRYLGDKQAVRLPYPLGNVLGGGAHAGKMAPDIQEFLAIPIGARRFVDAAFANSQVHKKVRALAEARDKTFTGGKGDEGAWAPNLDNLNALDLVTQACKEVSDEVGFEVRSALDVAASSFYNAEKQVYFYSREGKVRDAGEQIDFITELVRSYNIFYVEDPLQEEDFEGFLELTRKIGERCLICGDDLFVTNVVRIQKGIKMGAANAVLIKPNQIGTISDTLAAVKLAKRYKYTPVMSHRSGETADETIAHLAVAFGCPIIKTGIVGGERVAKLNELIRIEEELGTKTRMGRIL